MKSFLRIIQYIKQYWWAAILNIIFNILSIVFSLVSILMLIPFLELLFDRTPLITQEPTFTLSPSFVKQYFYYLMSVQINENKEMALIFFCIVVVSVFFLKNLFRYLALYMMAYIRNGVVMHLRQRMYSHILKLPISFFNKKTKGDIITRMTTDLQQIENGVMSVLEIIFREPITILFFLFAMLSISPKLTLFIFIMLLFTGIIIGQIGKSLKKESTESQQQMGHITSLLDETIEGLRIIKSFGAYHFLKKAFTKYNTRYFSLSNKMLQKHDLSSPLTEFMGIGIVCIVLWYGGRIVLSNMQIGIKEGLSPETFIGFMVVFSQLISPAKSFSTAFYKIRKGLASSDRIHEILDHQSEEDISIKKNIPDTLHTPLFRHSIQFNDISFSYEKGKKKAIKNIHLSIQKGQTIAIVGQSGAGKSTLVDLISRFNTAQQGEILIDGVDIKTYTLSQIRSLTGIVTQEPILFNDTVFNNIAFGKNDIHIKEVHRAAQIANAHDFISQLPQGYYTNIGDKGNTLSGGERQRITIARAVLQNPEILILDEATSSLDAASEKLVQEAMQKLMQKRTSFVIAHRLSTVQFADIIIVMHQGEIVEIGNHHSLLEKNGYYKNLVQLQMS